MGALLGHRGLLLGNSEPTLKFTDTWSSGTGFSPYFKWLRSGGIEAYPIHPYSDEWIEEGARTPTIGDGYEFLFTIDDAMAAIEIKRGVSFINEGVWYAMNADIRLDIGFSGSEYTHAKITANIRKIGTTSPVVVGYVWREYG